MLQAWCPVCRYDDYDYGEVNQLLERSLKVYIKTVTCYPERTTRRMYDSYWRQFRHSEKVRKLQMLVFVRVYNRMVFMYVCILWKTTFCFALHCQQPQKGSCESWYVFVTRPEFSSRAGHAVRLCFCRRLWLMSTLGLLSRAGGNEALGHRNMLLLCFELFCREAPYWNLTGLKEMKDEQVTPCIIRTSRVEGSLSCS